MEEKNSFAIIPKKIDGKQYDLMPEVDYSNLAFWEVGGVHLPIAQDNSKQGDKIVLEIVKKAEHGLAFDIDILREGHTDIINLARLRIKECDRLAATCEILNAFGIKASIVGDDLVVVGGTVKGRVIVDSYGDHRMAMTAAILATFADGKVTVKNAQVVKKSYPDFWEDYVTLGGVINVVNIR